jgi:hypothetical protein
MIKRLGMSLVVLVLMGLVAVPAGATTPKPTVITACGQVITTDAVLRTDLTCPGTALAIEASDVTVRLDGHTIASADGNGMGVQLGVPTGPAGPQGLQGVVVRGGHISGFATGVEIVTTGSMTSPPDSLQGTILTNNTNGVFVANFGAAPTLDHLTIVGTNGVMSGFFFPSSWNVNDSTITVTGVSLVTGGSTVDSSRLAGGTIDAPVGGGVTIRDSHLNGVTGECGDVNFVVTNSRIDGGTLQGGGGCYMDLSGNRFTGPGSGVAVQFDVPFSVPSILADNTFTGWYTAVIVADDSNPSSMITGDVFRHNVNGILGCPGSGPFCEGGTVIGNQFLDNSGIGLSVSKGTWRIGSNTALRNGGLGIDAQGTNLTVIDEGGDVARHNQPPQCVGVVCSSHR